MIDLLPNGTILIQWVIFIAAALTLHIGIFRPTLRILNERKARSEGEKETAKNLEEKSLDLLSQCEKKIEDARQIGGRKKEDLRRVAEVFTDDLLKKTRGELQQKMEETRQQIESEARKVSLELRQQSRDLARQITSKVLEREV